MESVAAPPDGPVGLPRLQLRNVSKTFRASRALSAASITVDPGEIHGLVGENGSGKSTLVKVLSGYHAPDPGGSLLIDGRSVELPVHPSDMQTFGLSVVHQDLGLIDAFSVVENMRVGSFRVGRLSRAIRWRTERELARASLAELGAQIEPDAPVAGLSPAERAEVAIARALQHHEPGRGLVMFDESTRALPPEPRRHFHTLLRDIVARGGSVLLVSHQLEEVLEHTHRVTVLRDGQVVADGLRTSELTEHELIRLMLGRELQRVPRRPRPAAAPAGPLARIEGLTGQTVTEATFSVAAGEVLGLTGLLGSGFDEVPYLLAGARPASQGTLTLGEKAHDLHAASVRSLLKAGVALVPERREVEGLAFSETVADNITLPRVSAHSRRVLLSRAWQREEAAQVMGELAIRPADPGMTVAELSGGNQQKVLLGKWLRGEPRLLVLHEPSQGVDVGARRDLELAIGRVAERGAAVILAGMDATELAAMCDRVLVMEDGRIRTELTGELTPEGIIDAVYGKGMS
ncbi:MAG: sugar ABC transporter ATP-binding protein [Solirubrobacteraceae bacterium]